MRTTFMRLDILFYLAGRGTHRSLGGLLGAALVVAGGGCDVPPPAPAGGGLLGDEDPGGCARGFAVVSSDFQSTSVGLVARDGTVLVPSLLSSGSAAPELSAALGGDVVLPTMAPGGDELVLLDRYPASVITWVDVRSATVRGQLSVATGFLSNPHDYVAMAPDRAYVTRFESNAAPGSEPFDAGGDLLELDPDGLAIVGRIPLEPALEGEPGAPLPRPDRAVRVGERILVLLGGYSADFCASAAARLVAVDPQAAAIEETLVLGGVHGCSGLALSPDGSELALACTGEWNCDGVPDPAGSAVVRVRTAPPLTELGRTAAAELGEGPVGMSVSYASPSRLVFTTLGRFGDAATPALDDALVELDLDDGTHHTRLRSAGTPFTLGDVSCDARCGVCLAADAGRDGGVLQHFVVSDSGLGEPTAIALGDGIGLPPRHVATF